MKYFYGNNRSQPKLPLETAKQTKKNLQRGECCISKKVPPVCSSRDRGSKTGRSTEYENFTKPIACKQQKLGQALMGDMSCKSRSVSMGLQGNAFQHLTLY